MSQQKNKDVYLPPKVKMVAFEVESGYQASLEIMIDPITTSGYRRLFEDGGSPMSSFWDNSSGNHFGTTTGYDENHEWTWD